jgi:hypothetical protein
VSATQPSGAWSTRVQRAELPAGGSWSGRSGSVGVGTAASPRVLDLRWRSGRVDRSDADAANRATSTRQRP